MAAAAAVCFCLLADKLKQASKNAFNPMGQIGKTCLLSFFVVVVAAVVLCMFSYGDHQKPNAFVWRIGKRTLEKGAQCAAMADRQSLWHFFPMA